MAVNNNDTGDNDPSNSDPDNNGASKQNPVKLTIGNSEVIPLMRTRSTATYVEPLCR